jgi:transposase
MKEKTFRRWEIDQLWLFPPSVMDFVPGDHLAHFVRETVRNDLDLSTIFAHYSTRNGHPPYHPAMMVSLLLYSLCRGVYSSRKIEQPCHERVDFMAVTGMAKPDHTTICNFRNAHRDGLSALFVQVLALCRDAGLANMGHVALDGTKVRANAGKHRAMSYKRMRELEPQLAAVVIEWFAQSDAADASDDAEHGADRRGDEIPAYIVAKVKRLAEIHAAQALLEAEAEAKAERIAARRAALVADLGHALAGRKPKGADGIPEDRAQTNSTDPESRIMKTTDGFQQCYNAQAAVDAESQVIVAATLSNQSSDMGQLAPLVKEIESQRASSRVSSRPTRGTAPRTTSRC